MITISDLSKTYISFATQIKALNKINLKINQNEIFGIFGKSGSGKSTFLKILNGFEKPSTGSVSVFDEQITTCSSRMLRHIRKNIGVVFQKYHLLNSLTIYKNIALPLEVLKLQKFEIDKRVSELMEFVGISNKRDLKPGNLSGGECQRVAIARALATNPKVLLCDEPTSALDRDTSKVILDLLTHINQKYKTTIIIVSHDEEEVKPLCHRFARFSEGSIQEVSSGF